MTFTDNDNYGFELYRAALDDMFFFHKNQLDKNGEPYYLHPMRVSQYFVMRNKAVEAVVSLLHDVIEDTACTLGYLEDRYPEEIVDAVDAITRRDGETYKSYVRRCVKNPVAMNVKKQDVIDNLRPERMCYRIPLDRYYWTLGIIDGLERENMIK